MTENKFSQIILVKTVITLRIYMNKKKPTDNKNFDTAQNNKLLFFVKKGQMLKHKTNI